jgi:hypothetical protein
MFRNRDLRRLPLSALVAEIERRGLEVCAPGDRDQVDGTDVLAKLGKIAREDFPEAVDFLAEVRIENAQLRKRAAKLDAELTLLAAAAVTGEFGDHEPDETE